jgi:hypothetical protein
LQIKRVPRGSARRVLAISGRWPSGLDAVFADLTGPATASHIHCCVEPPGNVGVATQTPTFIGFPAAASGAYFHTFDTTLASTWRAGFITANGNTPAGAEAAFASGLAAGQAYFNIHTAAFPGGEIRGFLAPVPEPATLTLVGLGLGAAAMRRRRARS